MNKAVQVGAAIAAITLCGIGQGSSALAEPVPNQQVTRPNIARAQACMPHERVQTKLHDEFGEKVHGRGISGDGTMVEIFLSGKSGTFTVIKTTPKGLSCVVDFGEGWQTMNQFQAVGLTPAGTLPH